MNRKKRKEAGAIAIESILSLTFFLMTILALMMGTMLIRAQAAMQYALNQTAKEISGYFYLLDKFGIASAISGNSTEAAQASFQQLNDSIGHIVSFSGEIKDDVEGKAQDYEEVVSNAKAGTLTDADIERIKQIPQDAKETSEAIKNEVNIIKTDLKNLKNADKKEMFKGVLQVFSKALINTALSKYVTPPVCEVLMPKYLSTRNLDNFYQQAGIIESTINFEGSQMLADGRTISLVVTYQVDASKLTLGFYKKNLQFQQIASTCAWIHPNQSGSLLSLKDVDYFFDAARNEAKAEERNELREALEAEKKAKQDLEDAYKEELAKHVADDKKDDPADDSKDDSKDDKDKTKAEIKLPPGVTPSDAFLRAYENLSDADKLKFNSNYNYLLNHYGKDLSEAINECDDKNAAVKLICDNAINGGLLLWNYGNDGLHAYKMLDYNSRKLLLYGRVKPGSPEEAELINLILEEKRTQITDKDIDAILKSKKDEEKTTSPTSSSADQSDTTTSTVTTKANEKSAAAVALLAKYPDCQDLYDKYGEEFVSAVGKCPSQADAIKAIRCSGQAALDAITKVPTAECVTAIRRYPNAATVISRYGSGAVTAITKASDSKYKNAQGVIAAIDKCGPEAIKAFEKATPTKECTDLIITYNDAALDVIQRYGDSAVTAVSKCNSNQKKALLAISVYQDKAIDAINRGGELNNGAGVVEAIDTCGPDAIDAFEYATPTKNCTDLLIKYKDDAAAVAVVCGDKGIDTVVEARQRHNNEAGTMQALSTYGDKALAAFEKVKPTKTCTDLMNNCGNDAIDVAVTYGEDGISAVSKLSKGYRSTWDDQKKALEDVCTKGDSALADIKKINSWQRTPRYQVYAQYKDVFDDDKYYSQKTGDVHWPRNEGAKGKITDVKLKPGTLIDRYGGDGGDYTSPYTDPPITYEARSLRPGTEYEQYSVFKVVEEIDARESEIAKWFNQPGGGTQLKLEKSIKDLIKEGKIVVVTRDGPHDP